jgi:hypothetical protein
MKYLTPFLFVVLFGYSVNAEVVFEGIPVKKILTSYETVETSKIESKEAKELNKTVISKIGDQYYWTSRNNKPLVKEQSGTYISYVSIDGSGYVRCYIPAMYELIEKLPPEKKAKEISYVEHVTLQFKSVTYYGNKSKGSSSSKIEVKVPDKSIFLDTNEWKPMRNPQVWAKNYQATKKKEWARVRNSLNYFSAIHDF